LTLKHARALLAYDNSTGGIVNKTTTLLNFQNTLFLSKNLDQPSKVKSHFNLDSNEEAQVLIDYYKGSMQVFTQYTAKPKLDYYKARFAREAILESITFLSRYTLNNITMKAFEEIYVRDQHKASCRDYFNSYADTICNSNHLSLDNYEGIVTWIIAVFNNSGLGPHDKHGEDPHEWKAIEFIMKKLGLKDKPAFWEMIMNTYFYEVWWNLQLEFQHNFGCFTPPCARKFIAETQYYNGSITYIPELYTSLNVKTVAGFKENKDLLKNKIPEIYGFYVVHYDFNEIIFGGEEDIIFSRNAGSILNYYQLMLMNDFARSGRTSDLAHLFNIWAPPQYFVEYMDHLLFEWFFDGLINEIPAKNLLFGENDRSLLMLVSVSLILEK
jgi:hypothetical protein